MPAIVTDPVSLTTHHLHLCFRPTDAVLSSGTGFIYERNGANYLITNWHNVTGRSPIDGTCLSDTLAVPDMVSTLFRTKDNPGVCRREHLPLYSDEAMQDHLWLSHPVHGSAVDVVAIPLPSAINAEYQIFPINKIDFDTAYGTAVADDAFVVGYPFSDITQLQLPIWKRASVASEPDVDLEHLPKLLIDTATRSGLSGSPVVMQRVGLHGASGGQMTGAEIIGRIRNFIGVYSGRIGADESKAQLGVVWKARVINEIIDGVASGVTAAQA
ncbi:trypsin-like peptidase domain-containing protein [Luteimonas sp. SDU101]|uniref:trypsin-like peptidase domain-containing protein n=1 Tax=unclassified Luteimonas TaxID=2629088 RepID=UPI003EBED79E